jgi:hypothetical protein
MSAVILLGEVMPFEWLTIEELKFVNKLYLIVLYREKN